MSSERINQLFWLKVKETSGINECYLLFILQLRSWGFQESKTVAVEGSLAELVRR